MQAIEESVVENKALKEGQRVFCKLNGGRYGYIYQIHGKQNPDSIQFSTLSVSLFKGSDAFFDVIFDDGSFCEKIPERIIHGVQWKHYDVTALRSKLNQMMQFHYSEKQRKEEEKKESERLFQKEIDNLKNASEWSYLEQGDDRYSGKLAAVNIRKELKRAFKKVKFSVRKEYYGSLRIRWDRCNNLNANEVYRLVNKYRIGNFNVNEDIYSTRVRPWHHTFGGAEYICCSSK